MMKIFEGHVDNPQPGTIADFDHVIENVRLFIEKDAAQYGGAPRHVFPTMEANILLLQRWGNVLYPPGYELVPYLANYPDFWVQHRRMKASFGVGEQPPEHHQLDLTSLVDELACEIMGWNIHEGSERGTVISPHVPIRPRAVVDPMSFEPMFAFSTSYGVKRKEP